MYACIYTYKNSVKILERLVIEPRNKSLLSKGLIVKHNKRYFIKK